MHRLALNNRVNHLFSFYGSHRYSVVQTGRFRRPPRPGFNFYSLLVLVLSKRPDRVFSGLAFITLQAGLNFIEQSPTKKVHKCFHVLKAGSSHERLDISTCLRPILTLKNCLPSTVIQIIRFIAHF